MCDRRSAYERIQVLGSLYPNSAMALTMGNALQERRGPELDQVEGMLVDARQIVLGKQAFERRDERAEFRLPRGL